MVNPYQILWLEKVGYLVIFHVSYVFHINRYFIFVFMRKGWPFKIPLIIENPVFERIILLSRWNWTMCLGINVLFTFSPYWVQIRIWSYLEWCKIAGFISMLCLIWKWSQYHFSPIGTWHLPFAQLCKEQIFSDWLDKFNISRIDKHSSFRSHYAMHQKISKRAKRSVNDSKISKEIQPINQQSHVSKRNPS